MFLTMFIAAVLTVVTVLVHVAGLTLLVQYLTKMRTVLPIRPLPFTRLLIRISWSLILIHVAEIMVWALFYLWWKCLPDAESAFYFSGVTYTTVGYGDLVLPKPWRMLAPVEALNGILMCGLSAAVFFTVLSRIYAVRFEAKPK
jgi:hypothetical protein